MELAEAIARRHMVRSFADRPVDPEVIAGLLGVALRAPRAGNTAGTAWMVLEGPETATYWEATTDEAWRGRSARWPGLSRAPVVALSLASPAAYLDRYSEADKVEGALGWPRAGGGGEGAWTVPYWFSDAAFATMLVLLGATDAGLGACFLGNFRGEDALLAALEVPEDWRLFGAVLLGHPDGLDHRSPSLARPAPDPGSALHWGGWSIRRDRSR
jgi:nitroreductase